MPTPPSICIRKNIVLSLWENYETMIISRILFIARRMGVAVLCMLALTACGGGFDTTRMLTAGAYALKAATISDEEVEQYVGQYVDYLDTNNNLLSEYSSYTSRLQSITSELSASADIPLNFRVYRTDDVNAFACADGSVRVFSGLMDLMTDDELRAVIGHEVGHVANHDSKNAFKKALLSEAVREGLASTGTIVGDLSDSALGDMGQALIQAKYSRDQEEKADEFAVNFLISRSHDPRALVYALEKLDNLSSRSGGAGPMQIFSTHPETRDRIARVRDLCRSKGYGTY